MTYTEDPQILRAKMAHSSKVVAYLAAATLIIVLAALALIIFGPRS